MREMSIRQVRDSLSRIQEVAESEGELLVTRHGRPVVKIVPLRRSTWTPSHADLRASMPRMKRSSAELIREDRDGS